eukprot:g19556.t1
MLKPTDPKTKQLLPDVVAENVQPGGYYFPQVMEVEFRDELVSGRQSAVLSAGLVDFNKAAAVAAVGEEKAAEIEEEARKVQAGKGGAAVVLTTQATSSATPRAGGATPSQMGSLKLPLAPANSNKRESSDQVQQSEHAAGAGSSSTTARGGGEQHQAPKRAKIDVQAQQDLQVVELQLPLLTKKTIKMLMFLMQRQLLEQKQTVKTKMSRWPTLISKKKKNVDIEEAAHCRSKKSRPLPLLM